MLYLFIFIKLINKIMVILGKKIKKFLLFIELAGLWIFPFFVVASPLDADSFFTVDIPEGWSIEARDKGSVTLLSPDAGIMVSLVTGLNGGRSRADIVEAYRKMLDAPDVRPRADDVYELQGHAGEIPMRGVLALGADRHVLVLLAGKVDDARAQAIVDSLALKK